MTHLWGACRAAAERGTCRDHARGRGGAGQVGHPGDGRTHVGPGDPAGTAMSRQDARSLPRTCGLRRRPMQSSSIEGTARGRDAPHPSPHHVRHAYKGQPAGRVLLERFQGRGRGAVRSGYLVTEEGRRVAAFGYWAGYAGAAVSLKCWAAQQRGGIAGPVRKVASKDALLAQLDRELDGLGRPRAIIIGALGRVGTGAADLCTALGVAGDEMGHGRDREWRAVPGSVAARDLPELHPGAGPGVRCSSRQAQRPTRGS